MDTSKLVITPAMISIITTYQCTSTCENCCFECSPDRKEKLTDKEIIRYVTDCVNTYKSIKALVLTGGEAFLYGNKLEKIIKHASSLNLATRIVTNGFWAKNYDFAYKKIQKLVKSGLNELNISTGDDHLKFVPISTVKNAALIALEHNLKVVINIESAEDCKFDCTDFLSDEKFKEYIINGNLLIVNGIWIPLAHSKDNKIDNTGNRNVVKPKKFIAISNTRCHNLFNTITIDPNHRMIACCGITSKRIKYLDLGNLKKYSIQELYENQFNDFLKIWMMVEGPQVIMKFISTYLEDINMDENLHPCQLCEMIFNNDHYLHILRDNYKKVYSRVILKYFLTKKELENETAQ